MMLPGQARQAGTFTPIEKLCLKLEAEDRHPRPFHTQGLARLRRHTCHATRPSSGRSQRFLKTASRGTIADSFLNTKVSTLTACSLIADLIDGADISGG
jgi:hypothetical protein